MSKEEGCDDDDVLLKFYSENQKMQSSNLVPNILPAVVSCKSIQAVSLSASIQWFLLKINSHCNHSYLAGLTLVSGQATLQLALAVTKSNMLCYWIQILQAGRVV